MGLEGVFDIDELSSAAVRDLHPWVQALPGEGRPEVPEAAGDEGGGCWWQTVISVPLSEQLLYQGHYPYIIY